jgi:hypothetical protein
LAREAGGSLVLAKIFDTRQGYFDKNFKKLFATLSQTSKQLLLAPSSRLFPITSTKMKIKRSKQYRKLMYQYQLAFGFREPYQVLGMFPDNKLIERL